MHDLNALKLFRDVVKAGGFAAAHRATGQSRATLSRQIAALETELGTQLIERSTRSFRLTAPGELLYERAGDILGQIDDAVAMVEDRQREPRGLVRFAIPPSVLHLGLGIEIVRFMDRYPLVRVQMEVSNREVDVRHEGFDFVVRARSNFDYPLDFVVAPFARMEIVIVSHPRWLEKTSASIRDTIAAVPFVTWSATGGESRLRLFDSSGVAHVLHVTPRLTVDDMPTARQAALDGVGLAAIPHVFVVDDIAAGRLHRLDFDLKHQMSILHAVHLGHRRMRPAVRHLLDWLKRATRHWK